MRRRLKMFLKGTLHIVERFFPVGEHAVVVSDPGIEDQAMAVCIGLARHNVATVYLSVRNHLESPFLENELAQLGIPVRKFTTPRGFLTYLRCRYYFCTHGQLLGNSDQQKSKKIKVNLWHGMPIKKLRADLEGDSRGCPGVPTLATSSTFAPYLRSAFRLEEKDVWEIGLPRNDRLIRFSEGAPRDSRSKHVIWLPTYRQVVEDQEYSSVGRPSPVNLENVGMPELDRLFTELGWTCTIKLHPMATRIEPERFGSVDLIDDLILHGRGETLYMLLARSEVLITDISSVCFDYLLLNRPIIFNMSDMESYSKSRGVYGSISLIKSLGPSTQDFDELSDELFSLKENGDSWSVRRAIARAEIHKYMDDSSTDRLLSRCGIATT